MKLLQLTPNLMVKNVGESAQFYSDLFGMEIEYLIRVGGENDEGFDTEVDSAKEYQYAGLRNGEFRLGLQTKVSILEDVKEISEDNAGTMSGNLYLEVEDLEQLKPRLGDIQFRDGGTSWYGMKEIFFNDPNGYVICVGQKDPDFEM